MIQLGSQQGRPSFLHPPYPMIGFNLQPGQNSTEAFSWGLNVLLTSQTLTTGGAVHSWAQLKGCWYPEKCLEHKPSLTSATMTSQSRPRFTFLGLPFTPTWWQAQESIKTHTHTCACMCMHRDKYKHIPSSLLSLIKPTHTHTRTHRACTQAKKVNYIQSTPSLYRHDPQFSKSMSPLRTFRFNTHLL